MPTDRPLTTAAREDSEYDDGTDCYGAWRDLQTRLRSDSATRQALFVLFVMKFRIPTIPRPSRVIADGA